MREKSLRAEIFACRQCGECCRGEKGILVTPPEAEAMARYLGISLAEFASRYLVQTPLGPQLGVAGDKCVMLVGNLCRVHPVKPRICREWPFLPALLKDPEEFEAAKEACPGISPAAKHRQFQEGAPKRPGEDHPGG